MEEERIETGRDFRIFRDVRRYTCEYRGIVRSKKSIINAHIQSHHQDEINEQEGDEEKGCKGNVCEEYGASFKKPAHFKQHIQSHSLKRPFVCPMEDYNHSYRRKDHLNRHLILHQGKIFECSVKKCNRKFSIHGNLTRHIKEIHDDDSDDDTNNHKIYAFLEVKCGKVFKYASKLHTHEKSHVKLETVKALCGESMKYFTNEVCLRAHIQACHQHIKCEICGSKQLKKNIKRYLRSHEKVVCEERERRIKCNFEGCDLTFSSRSNLGVHVKAAHYQEKPFVCGVSGCGMRFAFKHVRDNHEKSRTHVYTVGDFVKGDEEFLSRESGGGVKRKLPGVIDSLMRKRVIPINESDCIQGSDYISWLLSAADED